MDYNREQQKQMVRQMLRRAHRRSVPETIKLHHSIYGWSDPTYHSSYGGNAYGYGYSLNGLGADPQGGSDTPVIEGGVQAAANFVPIPGFGQAVGAVMSILNNVFGWGDSTPLDTLYDAVVELRLQLAEANHMRGITDTFHIPTGLDTSNAGEIETLGLAIVNDVLHKVPSVHLTDDTTLQIQHDDLGPKLWPAYVHEARADLYKAIAALKSEVGIGSNVATETQMTEPPTVSETDETSGTAEQSPATGATAFPSINWQADMPYILAGAGFLLLLTMAGKGSPNE